jgi:dipeptidase E|tara:strand:+ start:34756 stop:35448 length:693 start_codon:yes stop_codon:yes gene_type:complete
MKNLLLLSNSTNYGEQYMQWCKSIIASFVSGQTKSIVFVPYAAVDFSYEEYTDKVNTALLEYAIEVINLDAVENKNEAIANASAIFVGGGNTFHLLKTLQDLDLVVDIQKAVDTGTYYAGWSAGSNIATPSICTTNDMPIVQPSSFNALGLVDFQINPHYTERVIENHGGESRKKRLQEYLAANSTQRVVCIPEGTYIRGSGQCMEFKGVEKGKILTHTREVEIEDNYKF